MSDGAQDAPLSPKQQVNQVAKGSNWFQTQRLLYIDWALLNWGFVTRTNIRGIFNVSISTASADLSLFDSEHPGVMEYDRWEKKYVPTMELYQAQRGAARGPLTIFITEKGRQVRRPSQSVGV